jgi:hypothetical protein
MSLSTTQKQCISLAAKDYVRRQYSSGNYKANGVFKLVTLKSLVNRGVLEATDFHAQYHLTDKGHKVHNRFKKDWK